MTEGDEAFEEMGVIVDDSTLDEETSQESSAGLSSTNGQGGPSEIVSALQLRALPGIETQTQVSFSDLKVKKYARTIEHQFLIICRILSETGSRLERKLSHGCSIMKH